MPLSKLWIEEAIYLIDSFLTQKCLIIKVLSKNSKRPVNLFYHIDSFFGFFCLLIHNFTYFVNFEIVKELEALKQSIKVIFLL